MSNVVWFSWLLGGWRLDYGVQCGSRRSSATVAMVLWSVGHGVSLCVCVRTVAGCVLGSLWWPGARRQQGGRPQACSWAWGFPGEDRGRGSQQSLAAGATQHMDR